MSDYRSLSEMTGISQDVLRRLVSQGILQTDDPDGHRGVRRPFTGSDCFRAVVLAALARVGIPYADAGKLVAPLGCDGPVLTYAGKRHDQDAVLAVWTEEAGHEATMLPKEQAMHLLNRSGVCALVIVPLEKHWQVVAKHAEAHRANARTPDQNGWSRAFRRADGDHR